MEITYEENYFGLRALIVTIFKMCEITAKKVRFFGISPTHIEEFLSGENRFLSTGVFEKMCQNLYLTEFGKEVFKEAFLGKPVYLSPGELELIVDSEKKERELDRGGDELMEEINLKQRVMEAEKSRDFLNLLLEKMEISPHEMSQMTGVNPFTIANILRGKTVVSKQIAREIIDGLELTPNETTRFLILADIDRKGRRKRQKF